MGMLVLGRKLGERVIITLEDGRTIVIEYRQTVDKNRIRLGFDAPDSISILREEIATSGPFHDTPSYNS